MVKVRVFIDADYPGPCLDPHGHEEYSTITMAAIVIYPDSSTIISAKPTCCVIRGGQSSRFWPILAPVSKVGLDENRIDKNREKTVNRRNVETGSGVGLHIESDTILNLVIPSPILLPVIK